MPRSGYAFLSDRGALALRGADTRPFLQGLIRKDIATVQPDQAAYGALLTPQGKYLFDFFIVDHAGGLLLDAERPRLEELRRRLLLYRLRSQVEIEDVSSDFAIGALVGEDVITQLDLPERPGACRPLDGGLRRSSEVSAWKR